MNYENIEYVKLAIKSCEEIILIEGENGNKFYKSLKKILEEKLNKLENKKQNDNNS